MTYLSQEILLLSLTDLLECDMRVKIIKCRVGSYWYADKIGFEFEVEEPELQYSSGFVSYKLKAQPTWYIRVDDAEVVEPKQVLPTPESTLEWLQARQNELQNYVIQCMEYGDEIDKRVTKEYYVNQKRIAEIANV